MANVNDRRTFLKATAATALVSALPLHAQATWPSRSVRFVVPFAPGGTSEIVARIVAAELTKQLGQTVENKPGGRVSSRLQKSPPDATR